ncbi:MAG: hypothetical protein ACO32J_04660 [Phycisphaerales bacterium]
MWRGAALAMLLVIGGCAAPPADPLATPGDFTADVTVLAGEGADQRLEPWMRQGKMILFSDGTVLADLGPSVNARTRPGRARVLYQRQVRQLWDLARELGFATPELANFDGNPDLLAAEPGELVYAMTFSAGQERWTFVRRCPVQEGPDEATATWVKAMAEAGLLRERPADENLPIRYDFGPDPYAWFRPTASSGS